ncbi:MAG: energy-coupling factor transporter ATPase [Coriobacteriia bacterium]|nr:energy-coupling factor transporter ATPase [Coriobacteriia bacterium]
MLSFSKVCFEYPNSATWALDEVSLDVALGKRVALLGANGSGKSTLARLANGLLLPEAGTVQVDEFSSLDFSNIRALRQRCGVVAQDPDTQIVCTTVFDEVAFGPQNLKLDVAEIYERVEKSLAAVGLEGLRERDPNTLSGGEKQRLVIAGVLAMQPRYVVFDEPTSMLDAQGRAEVLAAIRDLQATGHGILHITHNLDEALEADEIAVLEAGRLIFSQSRKEFEQRADLMERFRVEPSAKAKAEIFGRPQQKPATSLVLERVSYTYSAGTSFEHQALNNINLTVVQGSVTLIAGHTGSGKSTLLRVAAGLLEPTEGAAFIETAKPNSKIELNKELNKEQINVQKATSKIEPGMVGLVFQHPESQLFAQTVFDDIAFGPCNIKLVSTPQETEDAVREACGLVGLDYGEFAQRSPFTLSGGEARRCALAGILAMKPQFLLLDEPTAGLDAQGHRFVAELIQKLRAQGIGVVVVSHEVDFFAPLANATLALDAGRSVPWQ